MLAQLAPARFRRPQRGGLRMSGSDLRHGRLARLAPNVVRDLPNRIEVVRHNLMVRDSQVVSLLGMKHKFHDIHRVNDAALQEGRLILMREVVSEKDLLGYIVPKLLFN
jgi:hypothetical protein